MNEMRNTPELAHLEQVKKLWSLNGSCMPLRNVTNHVFVSERAGEKCYVRLSHSDDRSASIIKSEIAFIKYIENSGIKAVCPWESMNGKGVETISSESGNIFYACVFPQAAGNSAQGPNILVSAVLTEWGSTLANLHDLAENYTSPPGIIDRPSWDNEAVLLAAFSSESGNFEDKKELTDAVGKLQLLYQSIELKKNYGIIHADLHGGNFFIHEEKLIIFDFDDACQHWFLYDIAVSATSLMQARLSQGGDDSALQACNDLLEGYLPLRNLSNEQRLLLLSFIRYRLLLIRLWWRARSEQGLVQKEFADWGVEFDIWSRKITAHLPLFPN